MGSCSHPSVPKFPSCSFCGSEWASLASCAFSGLALPPWPWMVTVSSISPLWVSLPLSSLLPIQGNGSPGWGSQRVTASPGLTAQSPSLPFSYRTPGCGHLLPSFPVTPTFPPRLPSLWVTWGQDAVLPSSLTRCLWSLWIFLGFSGLTNLANQEVGNNKKGWFYEIIRNLNKLAIGVPILIYLASWDAQRCSLVLLGTEPCLTLTVRKALWPPPSGQLVGCGTLGLERILSSFHNNMCTMRTVDAAIPYTWFSFDLCSSLWSGYYYPI